VQDKIHSQLVQAFFDYKLWNLINSLGLYSRLYLSGSLSLRRESRIDEIGTKIVLTELIQKERKLSAFLFQEGLFTKLVVNYEYAVPLKTFALVLYTMLFL
jgi:hypothetical protein